MKVYVIFAQRKCHHEGEYGVDALHCMTEYEYSDNPEYLAEYVEKYRSSGDYASVEIIPLVVDETIVKNILFPTIPKEGIPSQVASL